MFFKKIEVYSLVYKAIFDIMLVYVKAIFDIMLLYVKSMWQLIHIETFNYKCMTFFMKII